MSIRLRLTLLYSVILALTLVGFSAMVYGVQRQSTLQDEKRMLAETARHTAGLGQFGDSRFDRPPPPQFLLDRDGPPRTFGIPNAYWQRLSLDGEVIERSENLGDVTLPLSDAGLEMIWSGEPWVEAVVVEDEHLLIHSEPVIIEGQVAEIVQIARTLADQDQYLNTLARNLFIGSGVATITAFGVGWILSGVVLRPIHRITQTAQAIGAERDLSRRVEYTGPSDEIGQLATTFNRMLTELQAAYRQVEQSLQQQRQFVADVSHELRTPLTTLRGNLALLRREPSISADDQADVLDDMVDESDRLIRLVNDLLTLARAESQRALRSEPVQVKPVIEEVCRQAQLITPDRTITCAPLLDVAAVGDQDALKQVLLILMDNALKHTTGPITVTTAITDGGIAISIHDSGPGIDTEVLPHIFERFYRGDEAWTKPGLGLGLPIAKALVEAQNGTISVGSQVGQGSVVTVTVPQAFVDRQDS
jgi:two-component system OmpR family sensor kinase